MIPVHPIILIAWEILSVTTLCAGYLLWRSGIVNQEQLQRLSEQTMSLQTENAELSEANESHLTLLREQRQIPLDRTHYPLIVLVVGLPQGPVEAGRYTLGRPDIPTATDRERVQLVHVDSAAEAIVHIRGEDYHAVVVAQELHLHSPNEHSGVAISPNGILVATEAAFYHVRCVVVAHGWKNNLPLGMREMLSRCLLHRDVYRVPTWSEAVSLVLAE